MQLHIFLIMFLSLSQNLHLCMCVIFMCAIIDIFTKLRYIYSFSKGAWRFKLSMSHCLYHLAYICFSNIPHSQESQSVYSQVHLVYTLWTIHGVCVLLGGLLVVQFLTYIYTHAKSMMFTYCIHVYFSHLPTLPMNFLTKLMHRVFGLSIMNKLMRPWLISISWPFHSMTSVQEQKHVVRMLYRWIAS